MSTSDDTERTAAFMTADLASAMSSRAQPSSADALLAQPPAKLGLVHLDHVLDALAELQPLVEARSQDVVAGVPLSAREALTAVNLELILQPHGWLARTTGQAKAGMAEFTRQFRAADEALQALRTAGRQVVQRQGQQAAVLERLRMRLDVESAALKGLVEQGSKGLQAAHAELQKQRAVAGADAALAASLRQQAACYEPFVARFKLLRAVQSSLTGLLESLGRAQVQWLALARTLDEAVPSAEQAWLQVFRPYADAREQPRVNREWVEDLHQKLAEALAHAAKTAPLALSLDAQLQQALPDLRRMITEGTPPA